MFLSRLKDRKWKSEGEDVFEIQRRFFQGHSGITIFDIGAFRGAVTKTYRRLFPEARVYCFEPFPDSFDKLRRLSDGGSVKAYNTAVSDCAGTTELYVNFDRSCNSFFPRPDSDIKYYPKAAENTGKIEVKTITVDEFCDREKISKIDILKLDVEGAELKVLKGAVGKLVKQAVALVYTEVMFAAHYDGGCLFYEVSSFLARYNYGLFGYYNLKSSKSGQLRWGNAIFLSAELRAQMRSASST